jgi:AraC family transcriptional regulator
LYDVGGRKFLAKIAVELDHALARWVGNGTPGHTASRVVAQGGGWAVSDVICTFGPRSRPFEEQHSGVSIAIVMAGSFQYRASSPCSSAAPNELMTPGSLLLGNPGQYFECGHEHAMGDRCLAFHYTPGYFARIAAGTTGSGGKLDFHVPRLPPLQTLSPLIARACAGLTGNSTTVSWEEIGIAIAARVFEIAQGTPSITAPAPPSTLARVTRAARMVERHPGRNPTLKELAQEAGLSPYHFLRTFEHLTGATPHQFILRTRLRQAAMRLKTEPTKILDIALDCGFGDISNFNRAFRAEFGVNPRLYRIQKNGRAGSS